MGWMRWYLGRAAAGPAGCVRMPGRRTWRGLLELGRSSRRRGLVRLPALPTPARPARPRPPHPVLARPPRGPPRGMPVLCPPHPSPPLRRPTARALSTQAAGPPGPAATAAPSVS